MGYIYILTNPSFENFVKIGYATDVEERVHILNSSSATPYAFRIFATYEVATPLVDKQVHEIIDSLNPDLRSIDDVDGHIRKREFYEMTPESAYKILENIAIISGTKDKLVLRKPTKNEIAEEENAEKKKVPFNFTLIGLKRGDMVDFLKDETVHAIVVDDKHVRYKNKVYSLSALAKELTGYTCQGPAYFLYKGTRLCDMRED